MNKLEYPFRVKQIAQPVVAEVSESCPGGKSAASELLHRLRQQDLPTVSSRQEPCQPVERRSQVITAYVWLPLSRVQRHAHADRSDLTPIFGKHGSLTVEGGGHRVGSRGESRLDGITDDFVQHAVVRLDCLPEQGNVFIDGSLHGVTIALPERGAAFNIGEEKSDGAARQLGHDASFRRNSVDFHRGYLALVVPSNHCRAAHCVA
jgi:hypothetical protein